MGSSSFFNICRLCIIKTCMERARPGIEATLGELPDFVYVSVHVGMIIIVGYNYTHGI